MHRRALLVLMAIGMGAIPVMAQDDPTCANCPHSKTRHQDSNCGGDSHCLVVECDCESFGGPKVGN